MNDSKYIGLDVHQATISATVLDAEGKLVMEAILETKAETVLQLIHGLRGSLHVRTQRFDLITKIPLRRTIVGKAAHAFRSYGSAGSFRRCVFERGYQVQT